MFNLSEKQRYQRHFQLSEIGLSGQEKIKKSSVLVVGAGGLGCPILQYLTAMGIGTIGIIDNDKVSLSNLHRQILYTESDIGLFKVDCAQLILSKQNPHVQFKTYCTKLSKDNVMPILADYDVIVDGTDNFSSRYLINDACAKLKKPLVFGAIHKFEGQLSVFHYWPDNSKSGYDYRDVFPTPPPANTAVDCNAAGVIGVLPGIIGTLQAFEVIKIILQSKSSLAGEILFVNAMDMEFNKIIIQENKNRNRLDTSTYPSLVEDNSCTEASHLPDEEISAIQLQQLINNEKTKIQLIDVCEYFEEPAPKELLAYRIPLSELEERKHEIDQAKKIVFICKSGIRSKKALLSLRNNLVNTTIYSLHGGTTEWKKQLES